MRSQEKFTGEAVCCVAYTVIRFVTISAEFGLCTMVGLNVTLVEAKMRIWDTWMCVFKFQQVSHLNPDGENAKFGKNWDETDYSVNECMDGMKSKLKTLSNIFR